MASLGANSDWTSLTGRAKTGIVSRNMKYINIYINICTDTSVGIRRFGTRVRMAAGFNQESMERGGSFGAWNANRLPLRFLVPSFTLSPHPWAELRSKRRQQASARRRAAKMAALRLYSNGLAGGFERGQCLVGLTVRR